MMKSFSKVVLACALLAVTAQAPAQQRVTLT